MRVYLLENVGKATLSAEQAAEAHCDYIDVESPLSDPFPEIFYRGLDENGETIISPDPNEIHDWCQHRVGVFVELFKLEA